MLCTVSETFGRGPLAFLLGIQVWLLIGSLIALFDMHLWSARALAAAIVGLLAWRVVHNARLLFGRQQRDSPSTPITPEDGDRPLR